MLKDLTRERQQKARNGEFGIHVDVKKDIDQEQNTLHLDVFDDDFILDSVHCSNEDEEMEEEAKMKEAARMYLDEEAQENLELAIEETKQVEVVESKDCWNQDFFKPGNKVGRCFLRYILHR
jgi:predicted 3-demethylubiquinone-9 3-methyltransferase (glyoxalase superfamily)